MSYIGPTDRSFELHYATNVLSYLWLVFFSLGFFFLWQPVVQTSKLLTVLIEFACHYYGRGIWETAFLQWGVGFESQGKIQLLWKKPWGLSRCPSTSATHLSLASFYGTRTEVSAAAAPQSWLQLSFQSRCWPHFTSEIPSKMGLPGYSWRDSGS